MHSTDQTPQTTDQAPINWTNMILFTVTPALAVTLVPAYGWIYGFDAFEWAMFAVMMVFAACRLQQAITASGHIRPTRHMHPFASCSLWAVPSRYKMMCLIGRPTIAVIISM